MDDKWFLVIARACWADEFDLEYFHVLKESKLEKIKKLTKEYFETSGDAEPEIYFGTNEALTYSSYADWQRDFKVKEITEEDAQTLIKLFGKSGFGTGSSSFYALSERSEE